jgi:aminoglycoside phosphotransferase (APT) family kinase protein
MDQLTSAWLSQALGYTVHSCSVETLGEGGGLLGMVTRVTLESDGGPRTIIAKFPTQAPENRVVAETYDMYGREYRFYTQIAPTVPIRAPTCYHAQFNADNSDFVLLLEDLQGYTLGDQVTGCTAAEAHQVIETIAALHRNTWQPDHLTEIRQHDMPYQREGMKAGFQHGWPVVQEKFCELLDETLIDALNRIPDNVDKLLDRLHEGPLVIAHGDVRLDNIFFSDTGIALVDYQAVCKAAPEHDLAYFITQSLADHLRQSEDWIAVYHKHLTAEGIDYDLDLCRQRYAIAALYFICYAVIIAGTLDTANERGRTLAETLLGNSLRSITELNALELIE